MGLGWSNADPVPFSQAPCPTPRDRSLPEGIMCSAYRGKLFSFGGNLRRREEPRPVATAPRDLASQEHYPVCVFSPFPVPKPPQHTREETARGDMARERLGTSPLIRLHVQSQIPMRHCRPCRVRTLIQVKATWAPPAPACGEPGGMALPCSTPAASPRPLTLLNWKRSRLSLSRAGSCPGLRNRLILLSVRPSAERGRLLSRGRGEHTAPEPGLAPIHCSAEPRPPWASLPKPRRWPPLGQASSATLGLSKLHLQTAVPLGTGGTLYLEAWACCL